MGGGDEGTRKGHQALRGLSPLLGAGQARQFGQGGDVGGAQGPDGSREGSVWQEGQASSHLSTQETLAMVPGRSRGSQGPTAALEGVGV